MPGRNMPIASRASEASGEKQPSASSPLTSVPASWPRAGCTTSPGGLSTTRRSSSS